MDAQILMLRSQTLKNCAVFLFNLNINVLLKNVITHPDLVNGGKHLDNIVTTLYPIRTISFVVSTLMFGHQRVSGL